MKASTGQLKIWMV